MKKIQQEVKTYKDIYVSVDGKEFDNEEDCKKWEKSYEGTMEASWNRIKKMQVCDCDLGLPWSAEDHECYVLQPKDLDEIALLNAYIQSSTCNSNLTVLTTEHIGKMICLNFGYDHDYCDAYVLEDRIKKITDYVAEVTAKLNGKEEELK